MEAVKQPLPNRLQAFTNLHFINADEIAKELDPKNITKASGQGRAYLFSRTQ